MDSKVYTFTLLKKKKIPLRLDVIPFYITLPLMYINFFDRLFDPEDILASGVLILFICTHSVLGLMNFWSKNMASRIGFTRISVIEDASHVLVDIYFRKADRHRVFIVEVVTAQYLNSLTQSGSKRYLSLDYDPDTDDSNFAIDLNKKRMFWNPDKKNFV